MFFDIKYLTPYEKPFHFDTNFMFNTLSKSLVTLLRLSRKESNKQTQDQRAKSEKDQGTTFLFLEEFYTK